MNHKGRAWWQIRRRELEHLPASVHNRKERPDPTPGGVVRRGKMAD